MDRFGAAKAVFLCLTVLGWIVAGVGCLIALIAFANFAGISAILPAISGGISGVILVAFAQIGSAQIEVAENTADIRDILKAQQGAANAVNVGGRVKVYKGYEILKADGGVTVDGQVFSDVIKAEQWITAQSREA